MRPEETRASHDRQVTTTLARDLPGIRAIRLLARDAHRESWLVHLVGDAPAPAVLVRPLDERGARMTRIEAVALHRARGPGVAALLDVVDDARGAGVLRAHVTGVPLSTLLGERERWDAGEVVGVLRPLVASIARLHRCGVALGALRPAELVASDAGVVIVELARGETFAEDAPEAALARVDAVGRDRDALRGLTVDLLRRVTGSRARAAQALADAVEHVAGAELLESLRVGLDELAAPVSLGLAPEPASAVAPAVARLTPVVRDDLAEVDAPRVAGIVARVTGILAAARPWLDALPARRRRVLVAGSAAVAAAAVLLALPANAPDPSADTHPSAEPSTAPGSAEPAAGSAGRPVDGALIAGDDPLAAAVALVELRESCFAELSLLCLEQVDQAGSSALAADRTALQTLRDGGEASHPVVDPVDARLIERLGDGALVELGPQTAPASLLLMRSEAGWRIRDWIDAGDAD